MNKSELTCLTRNALFAFDTESMIDFIYIIESVTNDTFILQLRKNCANYFFFKLREFRDQ